MKFRKYLYIVINNPHTALGVTKPVTLSHIGEAIVTMLADNTDAIKCMVILINT